VEPEEVWTAAERTGLSDSVARHSDITSFVGRREELGTMRRLFADSRLLTLIGAGGVGKTRLAKCFAEQVRRSFADRVWFVDLTTVRLHDETDLEVAAGVVAETLGLPVQAGRPATGQLVAYVREMEALIVLDNCEHLIEASASVAAALLKACPHARLLATSREPLQVSGEQLYEVPPMSTDTADADAVALFTARARAVCPGFELTDANSAAVSAICRQLDGLPLAIELAASWVRVLSPAKVLERLGDRFALLQHSARERPARQQTLRACVEWSYDLCSPAERTLWARTSVFVDGCELDAIEDVCGDDELPRGNVLGAVAGLVDKSVLIHEPIGASAETRYRVLETIREFGQERAEASGEAAWLREQHLHYYRRLVAQAQAEWTGDQHLYWMTRLRREHANVRSAVEYCLAAPERAEVALQIAGSVPNFYWTTSGRFAEGRTWLARAVAATGESSLQARALLIASYLAFAQGDGAAGTALLDRGTELAARLGSAAELAYAAFIRGLGALYANETAASVEVLERARAMFAGLGDGADLDLRLHLLIVLGIAAELDDRKDLALECKAEMLAVADRFTASFHRSAALWGVAVIDWHRGALDESKQRLLEVVRLTASLLPADSYGFALCIETLAWLHGTLGDQERAARLLGLADAIWTQTGVPISSYAHFLGFHDECVREASADLGADRFTRAFDRGRTTPRADVLPSVLGEPDLGRADGAAPALLTPREEEIAELVAQGLTNREIARRLVISPRTADGHVERILVKLGFTRRAQIAAWVCSR
jgi:predicted ATPase/DNA-binding CsgD family transcriptional regulator